MDIRYARELLVLAEYCNYAEASDRLFISQSALFKHVKSIESEFGITVFEKRGKHIELTGEGEILLKYVKQHIELDDRMLNEIDRYHNKDSKIVILGIQYRVIQFVYAFRKRYSKYLVQYIGSDFYGENAAGLLRAGKCELAFLIHDSDVSEEFDCLPVTEDEVCVCLYASHPLAGRDVITFSDIENERFIMRGSSPSFTEEADANGVDFVRRLFAEHGKTPKAAAATARSTDILEYVRHGIGISLLLRKSISDMDLKNVVLKEMDPEDAGLKDTGPRDVGLKGAGRPGGLRLILCWRKGEKLSSGAAAFVSFIRAAVRMGRVEEILAGEES